MKSAKGFLFVLLVTLSLSTFAQTPVPDNSFMMEAARRLQLNGEADLRVSHTIRPLYRTDGPDIFNSPAGRDSLLKSFFQLKNFRKSDSDSKALSGKTFLALLPVTLIQQYNTHHPYGWNDGSMIPSKGYQNQLSLGFFFRTGHLSLQLRPEMVYARNRYFGTFPSRHSDSIWRSYYNTVLNMIDEPERYGNGNFFKIFPGQSALRINSKKLSLGLSTENLWWGPGIRNSLMMSNNAPGFPHLTFNSISPVVSPIGSFEWQLISGKLKSSGILPQDTSRQFNGLPLYITKQEGSRYLNGLIFTWQPKWTRGLFLGFSRVYYQYQSDVPSTVNGYLPVLSRFFKAGQENEDSKKRDQMISFFFRLVLPGERAELYGEYGRNDHSQNLRDFLLEPEHSRAYIIGFTKLFEQPRNKNLELFAELTNLQIPATIRLREQSGWYSHYQVRHGYTNQGQVMGAGIGTGSSSQTIGLHWISGPEKTGATVERVVRNNDFYYDAFTPQRDANHHWVDLSVNINKSWVRKRMVYDAHLSFINSLNYQWYRTDVKHISARIAASYFF